MTNEKKRKVALTINKLTDQEKGICEEALHHGIKQLHRMTEDLKVLPAHFTQSEAMVLLALTSELPAGTRAQVRMLMGQLRAAAFPIDDCAPNAPGGDPGDDGGTIIHIPPP